MTLCPFLIGKEESTEIFRIGGSGLGSLSPAAYSQGAPRLLSRTTVPGEDSLDTWQDPVGSMPVLVCVMENQASNSGVHLHPEGLPAALFFPWVC